MAGNNNTSWIPEFSEEELERRATKIRPVARLSRVTTLSNNNPDGSISIITRPDPLGEWSIWGEGELYYLKPVSLTKVSYIWDPQPEGVTQGLSPVRDITTYHRYGYHGLFKPSIGEVLSQIPEELLDLVIAFEIVEQPENLDDLHREQEALNAGYHVAKTRLYKI